jgi:hypothetical protein
MHVHRHLHVDRGRRKKRHDDGRSERSRGRLLTYAWNRSPTRLPGHDGMPPKLKAAFTVEMALAKEARRTGQLGRALAHLERAHILSQRWTLAHVRSHLGMLRIGWMRRDWREIVGQLARIPAALVFSRIWIPVGNTGGANVSATRSMPIPDDLRAVLDESE